MIVIFEKKPNERFIYLMAGQSLDKHQVVTINNSGKLIPATNSNLALLNNFKAITLEVGVLDQPCKVACEGYVNDPAWSFDTTQPVYMGIDGGVTQIAPSDTSLVIVGYPTSATNFFIEFQMPILVATE